MNKFSLNPFFFSLLVSLKLGGERLNENENCSSTLNLAYFVNLLIYLSNIKLWKQIFKPDELFLYNASKTLQFILFAVKILVYLNI